MRSYTGPLGLIRIFEAQFEEDGTGGYLYRRNAREKPIPVGADERRRFIDRYAARIFPLWGGMLCAALGAFFYFYWPVIRSSTHSPSVIFSDPYFYAGSAAIILPTYALMRWLQGAPARALKNRDPVGQERTGDEMRALRFRSMSYPQLALIALVGGGSYTYITDGHWDRRWMFVPPLVVLVTAVQAFRKWRFERLHPELR
jgi:hypothetical protein